MKIKRKEGFFTLSFKIFFFDYLQENFNCRYAHQANCLFFLNYRKFRYWIWISFICIRFLKSWI